MTALSSSTSAARCHIPALLALLLVVASSCAVVGATPKRPFAHLRRSVHDAASQNAELEQSPVAVDLLQVVTPAPTTDPNDPRTCGTCFLHMNDRAAGDEIGSCVPVAVAMCVEQNDTSCRSSWDARCVSAAQMAPCNLDCPKAVDNPNAPIVDTGLSVGWIFSIVVLSTCFAYFFFGMCYNCRGDASGLDVLPNSDMWRNLPGLVKDGCLASWYCVVGAPKDSYDFIDEKENRR